MSDKPANGTVKEFGSKICVFYDGYWIRYYPPPEDSLAARKELIDHLTRRTFHHTESGINTPGDKLDEARKAYESETDPARKRVNGAMLAGALFNRATDIFTSIVELEQKGIEVSRSNELMKECGACFKEALDLGKLVKHYSGEEGIDELWGEPLRAFTLPIASYYETRYIKIAQTMRSIDEIAEKMVELCSSDELLDPLIKTITEFAGSAKLELETTKSDPVFFEIWPRFIASREALEAFEPDCPPDCLAYRSLQLEEMMGLIRMGTTVITYLSKARVPMPRSVDEFFDACARFESKLME